MVISIFKFLAGYYGITMDAGRELTHSEAKKNFRFLKGCPFKYAEANPELIGDGKIIYVKDSYGIILPYICPEKVMTSEFECSYTEEERVHEVNDKSILDELSEMPTYMVHELLSKYKDKPSFYRVIKRELICRGVYKNKKYKLRKETLEIELEGGKKNDKYQRRREIKCKKS